MGCKIIPGSKIIIGCLFCNDAADHQCFGQPPQAAPRSSGGCVAGTAVVRVDIETMTGKEDLGSGELREKALEVLRVKLPMPVFLKK